MKSSKVTITPATVTGEPKLVWSAEPKEVDLTVTITLADGRVAYRGYRKALIHPEKRSQKRRQRS